MKTPIALSTAAMALLLFPALTAASPAPAPAAARPALSSPSPHSGAYDWNITLFKDKKCDKEATKLSGSGSTECRTDVPKGGAQAFEKVSVDSHCRIILYKDSKCSKGDEIGTIHTDSKGSCATAGGKKKKHVKSWRVEC